MSQSAPHDSETVAAALQGAFAVMAARIGARQDSRLLVDNQLIADEVYEIVSLTLGKLQERSGADVMRGNVMGDA